MNQRQRSILWVTTAACAALGACKGRDNAQYASRDTVSTTASMSGSTSTTPSTSTDTTVSAGSVNGSNGWTDGQIIAFASAANRGEIAQGKLAEHKATSSAVKAFAKQMVTDHTAMQKEGSDLAKKLSITPDTTKSDVTDLEKGANDGLNDLRSKPAGQSWDSDYVNKQVDAHQHVLDELTDAAKATQNSELRAMLEQATGTVQKHLTRAKALMDNVKS
jgi:putative membrane protein